MGWVKDGSKLDYEKINTYYGCEKLGRYIKDIIHCGSELIYIATIRCSIGVSREVTQPVVQGGQQDDPQCVQVGGLRQAVQAEGGLPLLGVPTLHPSV